MKELEHQKTKEGDQFFKAGLEKYTSFQIKIHLFSLKTGLFKWSKDYVSAAYNFDEAGINKFMN